MSSHPMIPTGIINFVGIRSYKNKPMAVTAKRNAKQMYMVVRSPKRLVSFVPSSETKAAQVKSGAPA